MQYDTTAACPQGEVKQVILKSKCGQQWWQHDWTTKFLGPIKNIMQEEYHIFETCIMLFLSSKQLCENKFYIYYYFLTA